MTTIKVRLVTSTAGCLGLRRINHVVELADTPAVRGMIDKVNYLVRIDAT